MTRDSFECMFVVYVQLVLSCMVSIVEPLLCDIGDKVSSVESELVLLTLRRFNESAALTLTPSCCEMKLLLHAVTSRRRIATNDCMLAAAAIAQVSPTQQHTYARPYLELIFRWHNSSSKGHILDSLSHVSILMKIVLPLMWVSIH